MKFFDLYGMNATSVENIYNEKQALSTIKRTNTISQ